MPIAARSVPHAETSGLRQIRVCRALTSLALSHFLSFPRLPARWPEITRAAGWPKTAAYYPTVVLSPHFTNKSRTDTFVHILPQAAAE